MNIKDKYDKKKVLQKPSLSLSVLFGLVEWLIGMIGTCYKQKQAQNGSKLLLFNSSLAFFLKRCRNEIFETCMSISDEVTPFHTSPSHLFSRE